MGENAAYAIHGTTEVVEHPDMPDGLYEWFDNLLESETEADVVRCNDWPGIKVTVAGVESTVALKTVYQAKPAVTGFVACYFDVYESTPLLDLMAERRVAQAAWLKLQEIARGKGITLPDAFTYVVHDRE